jgi:hypothetical protein
MSARTIFTILRVLYLMVAIPLGLICLFAPPIGWVIVFVLYEVYGELKSFQRVAMEVDAEMGIA